MTSASASSGAIGSPVTITGTGFNGVTAVKFGDVASAFAINSDTSITATVPAGAGIAPIILSKPGCVDAQTQSFTAFPAITLTPVTTAVTAGVPGSMRVSLRYSPTNSTAVTLDSSNTSLVTVPASILIPAGARAADFAVNGLVPGGSVTVTAKLPANLGGGMASASVTVAARVVSMASTAGSVGRSVAVPIVLESKGDETSVSFSVSFNPALLTNPQFTAGSDSGNAQFTVNSAQVSLGLLGVGISQPAGQKFAAGLRQIAMVIFDLPPSVQAETALIDFGDLPVTRTIANANGATIQAQFVAGSVRIGQGDEADVAPRPSGQNNGGVTITDWVQIGRFATGLDTPAIGNEFQRADCAPRETLGDGKITLIDWVQAGRYVAGLDVPVVAGGPTAPMAEAIADCGLRPDGLDTRCGRKAADSAARRLMAKANAERLAVHIAATGNENALGFSVNFDPQQWRFVTATVGRDARQAMILVNSTQLERGRVGIAVALSAGQALHAGDREAVVLQFTRRRRTAPPLDARFIDRPVAAMAVDSSVRLLPVRTHP